MNYTERIIRKRALNIENNLARLLQIMQLAELEYLANAEALMLAQQNQSQIQLKNDSEYYNSVDPLKEEEDRVIADNYIGAVDSNKFDEAGTIPTLRGNYFIDYPVVSQDKVILPEVVVNPDWELNKRIRDVYRDKLLRLQLLRANQYIVDLNDTESDYDPKFMMGTNEPIEKLLLLHNSLPNVSIHSYNELPDEERELMPKYSYDDNRLHMVGRAKTVPYIVDDVYDDGVGVNRYYGYNIYVDPLTWDPDGIAAYDDLLSEYSHPFNYTYLPIKYNYTPPSYREDKELYEGSYEIPNTNEFSTHLIVEPSIQTVMALRSTMPEQTPDSVKSQMLALLILNNINKISPEVIKDREGNLTKEQKRESKRLEKDIKRINNFMEEHHIPRRGDTYDGAAIEFFDKDGESLTYADGGDIDTTTDDVEYYGPELPEVIVRPDLLLALELQRVYSDRDLRLLLERASQYIVDKELEDSNYNSRISTNDPLKYLLTLHNSIPGEIKVEPYWKVPENQLEVYKRQGNPYINMENIADYYTTPDMSSKIGRLSKYYDIQKNYHDWGRAKTVSRDKTYDQETGQYVVTRFGNNVIYIDPGMWDPTGMSAWNDLIAEYSHPFALTLLPLQYNYKPLEYQTGSTSKEYNLQYDLPYTHEYMTHKVVEPVIARMAHSPYPELGNYLNANQQLLNDLAQQINTERPEIIRETYNNLKPEYKNVVNKFTQNINELNRLMNEYNIPLLDKQNLVGVRYEIYDKDTGDYKKFSKGGKIKKNKK